MASVNRVTLVGNLGRDPELKNLETGALCNFSVATSESWQNGNGERQERTEWHRVVAFGMLAETCAEYLKKGRQVYVEGTLRTREFEKDGQKRFITEVKADDVQFLGSRNGSSQS